MIRFRHYSLTPNKPKCWIFQVIKSVAESPMPQKIGMYAYNYAPHFLISFCNSSFWLKWMICFVESWLVIDQRVIGSRMIQIVTEHVLQDASYRQGQGCARGHVGRVVLVVTVFLPALLVTMMHAPATPTWLPTAVATSALKILYSLNCLVHKLVQGWE